MSTIDRSRLSFAHEDDLTGTYIVGVDEVGYGAWAGPITVCAVWIDRSQIPQDFLDQLDDSKKLSPKKREWIASTFLDQPLWGHWAVKNLDVMDIHQGRVLANTLKAMECAVNALPAPNGVQGVIIDGKHKISQLWPQKTVPGGDGKSYSIALASIIAKCNRDQTMVDLSPEFPFFGWEKNKGYGTSAHQFALRIHGLSIHHRPFYCRRLLSPSCLPSIT